MEKNKGKLNNNCPDGQIRSQKSWDETYNNMRMRNLKFWGSNFLQSMGIALGMTLVMLLFYGMGQNMSAKTRLLVGLGVLPYYLFMSGAISIMMIIIGYFQMIFSVLISMNATRSSVNKGIFFSEAAVIVTITALGALIWKVMPGDIASDGIKILPLLCGILFAMTGAGMILGAIIMKWGKFGAIIATIVFLAIGGVGGAGFALTVSSDMVKAFQVLGNIFADGRTIVWTVLAAGVIIYIISGIFTALVTRKMEVRM